MVRSRPEPAFEDMGPDAQFRSFLREGRFMIQKSRATGKCFFYPRALEPGTGSTDYDWIEASGKGVVHSVTVIHPRPPGEPYNVALVDLEEGPRMMSRVEGMPLENIKIGMKVVARIAEENNERFIVFDPA